jgi:hypothetical protein
MNKYQNSKRDLPGWMNIRFSTIKELSGKEAVSDYAPDSPDTIFPAYLFPFFISASGIGYSNFIDTAVEFGNLGSYFRLKPESIFFNLYFGYYFFFECLIISFLNVL